MVIIKNKSLNRTEVDSLGKKQVPRNAYFGIQTARALENFPVSGLRCNESLIKAYVQIKKAACIANCKLKIIDKKRGDAIVKASDEILAGYYRNEFRVDAFQAGGGTSLNMNINEVLANRALEILGETKGNYKYLSPNDHVNRGQSTNDTFPTALHLASLEKWSVLDGYLDLFVKELKNKSKEFRNIVKAGRTHLQDAVPMRLGQEFGAYAHTVERSKRILQNASKELYDIAIGGTAVGTGLNTTLSYQKIVIGELRGMTDFPVGANPDLFEAIQSMQSVGYMSSALRILALELIKILNDLRLLSSGPATGLAEIKMPEVQPGSSIMPAKINPSMAECLNMICFQVIGNDTAIAFALQAGQLELNVMMPVIAHNVLQSFDLFNNFLPVFINKCIKGITAEEENCRLYSERTVALGTVLSTKIGYLETADLIKDSIRNNQSILKTVIDKKIMSSKQANALFNIKKLSKDLM